jgi:hypothetical protein
MWYAVHSTENATYLYLHKKNIASKFVFGKSGRQPDEEIVVRTN